jgi:outer membrane protein OmpA-like peptidoglycan-associated protein
MSRLPGSATAAGLALAALTLPSAPAWANDLWFLVGETSAGVPMGDPQRAPSGPGGSAAIAGYRSLGRHAMAGLRLRGGLFGAGDAPGTEPGMGGLGALSFALRLTPLAQPFRAPKLGLWMEGAGGGGVAGSLGPLLEAGIGLGFQAGSTVMGPSVRYLQVVKSGAGPGGRDARIALLGLEVAFYDRKKHEPPFARMALQPIPPPLPRPAPSSTPPPNATSRDADGDHIADVSDRCPDKPEDIDRFEDDDGCPEEDNDGDHIVDARDLCPEKAEVVNGVEDEDGCPDTGGAVQVIDDRVVLDESVLFDSERARVRTAGQRVLAAIVDLWRKHPEWESMQVEGHADSRGPEKFNQWLSEERAQRVRATLIRLGVPEAKVTAKGFGATRPLGGAGAATDLPRNRRVELVVIRKSSAATATAP